MVTNLDYAPPETTTARSPAVSLRDISLALRRRRLLILSITVIGTLIGTAGILALPVTYTAESSLVLDARRPRVVDLPSLVSEQTTNPDTAQLRSEVEILQSEDLAARVITRLGLLRSGLLQPHPTPWAGVLAGISGWLHQAFPRLAGALQATPVPATAAPRAATQAATQQAALAAAVRIYRRRLAVATDGRSYVIRVQYSSRDPQLAARIVNTHVDLYLADQVSFKRAVGQQASQWLAGELASLQAKLRSSEDAVQQFREKNQIIESGDTTLLAQQLAAVNAEIPVTQTERAAAEARLQRARDLLGRGAIESQSAVLDSPLIQQLRLQEALLLRRQAEFTAVYGDHHPEMIKIAAELHDLQASIREAAGRIVKNLESEVQIARNKEAELHTRLIELEQRSVSADRAKGKLRDLQREVSANSSLIEVLLNRYKQVSAQEEIQQADARVVSLASPPTTPSSPNLRLQLPILVVASLLLGCLAAFLKELIRRGFKGSNEIEVECELPNLGSVPMVPRAWPRNAAPADLVIDAPHSSFSEAIRSIRNSIQVSALSLDAAPKTLLVTSSLPHEGKSATALSLARSYARSGRRVLLIDCDLRKPSIARLTARNKPRPEGLGEIITGQVFWRDARFRDEKSSLDLIGADNRMLAPHDLLGSSAMRDLLERCQAEYDLVILDSPPITAVSDPLILARLAHATMLVVRWGSTPREIAKTSLNKLFHSGARICGVVLTQVDMRHGVFSPDEIEYYHKHNRTYYVH